MRLDVTSLKLVSETSHLPALLLQKIRQPKTLNVCERTADMQNNQALQYTP